MKDNRLNNYIQAINEIEYRLRKDCRSFDILTTNQKLCLALTKFYLGKNIFSYMEKLLNDGASLNYVDEYGKTLLDIALYSCHKKNIFWLINKGAADHLTPNQKLCMLVSIEGITISRSSEALLNKLLQEGADINYVDHYGKTPLEISIDQRNVMVALWIANKGAKKDIADKKFFSDQLIDSIIFWNYNISYIYKPYFEELIKHGATVKSSVISKILDHTSPDVFKGSKLGDLVHREFKSNLGSCTIHKFVLFEKLKLRVFT